MRDDNGNLPRGEIPHAVAQQDQTAPLALAVSGKGEGVGRPRVLFTLCRVQLLDRDNAYASVKDLLDGLCAARCLLRDDEASIELVVEQTKVATRKEERTEIRITPCA